MLPTPFRTISILAVLGMACLAPGKAASNQLFPAIASDGAGGAVIAWMDTRDSGLDIFSQHVNAGGALLWAGHCVAVCTEASDQLYPAIVPDGAGGAIVAWFDYREGGQFYAQRVNASGVLLWAPDGVALNLGASVVSPAIASDGGGGVIVTWFDARGADYDIYAQRVDGSGVLRWTEGGVPLCTAAGHQVSPSIVSDGVGGAIVTWFDSRPSAPWPHAQRVNRDGVPQWTADGVTLCTGADPQDYLKIISDGAQGAIVAWSDFRNGIDGDIYGQRVNASGVRQWPASGVAVCTSVGEQDSPTIAPDGAGGAIAAWTDSRNGGKDIYVRRVTSTGNLQWTANGVALCTALSDQLDPTIVSDGAGGAIVVWLDTRNSGTDIYGGRVNSAGAPLWTANGQALCGPGNEKASQAIVSDGSGGAVVTWFGNGSGTQFEALARRVDIAGIPRWAADGVALCPYSKVDAPAVQESTTIWLGPAEPNPVQGSASFRFALPKGELVKLELFDEQGRRVRTLVGGYLLPGEHAASWDGRDRAGRPVPAGLYFCRLEVGGLRLHQPFTAIH